MSTTTTYANAFYTTRDMFRTYTAYNKPLSYDQWSALPDDHKAAVLYVQFFEQITLAWNKTKSFYTLEEDGVSTIMQYLMKNVPVIEANKNRFTAAYIYKVAYNCLYCICHDIKRDKDRYDMEISNIVFVGDDEVDLFATFGLEEVIEEELRRKEFWKLLEDEGAPTFVVINKILGGTAIDLGENGKRLRISEDEFEVIVQRLKEKLACMLPVYGLGESL